MTRDPSKHGSKTYSETPPTFQTIPLLLTVAILTASLRFLKDVNDIIMDYSVR